MNSKVLTFLSGFVCGVIFLIVLLVLWKVIFPLPVPNPNQLQGLNLGSQLIYECARISKHVYLTPDKDTYGKTKARYEERYDEVLWEVFQHDGFSKPIMILRKKLDKERKIQIVCVAGSDGFKDWNNNLQFRLKEELTGTGIMVHPRFKELAEELYDKEIKDQLKSDYTTYITGHSLGGAVAAMIGLLIERDNGIKKSNNQVDDIVNLERVITFGQPKFTNVISEGELDLKSGIFVARNFPLLRVVVVGDPVPMIPPYSAIKETVGTGRYSHFGDELILLGNGKVRFEAFLSNGEINMEHIDRSDLINFLDVTLASIVDNDHHFMVNYIDYLEGLNGPGSD